MFVLGFPNGSDGKESAYSGASLVAQTVKNLPAVRSLGWEDSLEKGTAIHSSILAWRKESDTT